MALSKILTATNTATASNTITIAVPASPAVLTGDLMLVCFVAKGGTNNTFTDVAGTWANIASDDSGTNISGELYWKLATGSENGTTYSFEIRQSGGLINRAWTVGLIVIRGADATTPVLSSGMQVNGFGGTCTAPSISLTGATADAWALMWSLANRGTTVTQDADYVEDYDVQSGANTTDTTIALGTDTTIATSGTTGTQASTLAASAVNIGVHAVINEAAGAGTQTVIPSGIASGEAFGSHTVAPGSVTVTPSGIASAEAFGTTALHLTIAPSGIASAEAFGDATIAPGAATVAPTGIASDEAFGDATVAPGAVTVAPTGIASGEAFGDATVLLVLAVLPDGIASAEAFGDATIAPGAVTISPTGIASAEAFGDAVVTATGGTQTVVPDGIASAEAFGTPLILPGAVTLLPAGIATGEAFGTAVLTDGSVAVVIVLPLSSTIARVAGPSSSIAGTRPSSTIAGTRPTSTIATP